MSSLEDLKKVDLGSYEVNEAAWEFIRAYRDLVGDVPNPLFNNVKHVLVPAFQKYVDLRVANVEKDFQAPRREEIKLDNIVQAVWAVNPKRSASTLNRRLNKLFEEGGECAEAVLEATSSSNAKGKTFMDVREEAIDAAIVGLCLALTPIGEETPDETIKCVLTLIGVKLAKWDAKVKAGKDSASY